jgi:hypothetical protein
MAVQPARHLVQLELGLAGVTSTRLEAEVSFA